MSEGTIATPPTAGQWTTVPRADKTASLVLPEPVSDRYKSPEGYDPSPELVAAANVALWLGQPLLLTGEPGCGKTSVGEWLAWQLGLGRPLVHNVKSTTLGRDLLYTFDELARFRDAQARRGSPRPQHHYMRLNALGLAIVLSGQPDTPLSDTPNLTYRDLTESRLPGPSGANLPAKDAEPHRFGRRHVVLIDELDKAPRDTPNDLLFEIERMEFAIPEIGTVVAGDPSRRPIVIITSNSEKSLPEPFLRRCIFHHIEAPDAGRRRDIIARRQHPFARRQELFTEAMDLFESLREALGRSPGTAELLAWLDVLDAEVQRAVSPVTTLKGLVRPSLGILAKTREDLERAQAELVAKRLD
jgi:MoxR-like ATPase